MKHILTSLAIALPLIYGADIAMALTPGMPPLTGPGSVFHGNEEVAPPQKPRPKHKSRTPASRLRQQGATSRNR